jgi:hypothetical protein
MNPRRANMEKIHEALLKQDDPLTPKKEEEKL